MIVSCAVSDSNVIPTEYLNFGYDNGLEGHIASTVGKSYRVYAHRQNRKTGTGWYLIYTDNGYLWWMPACAYRVLNEEHPKGWTTVKDEDYVLHSYPALHDWKIEEGIIDGEVDAERALLEQVSNDPTFPTEATINELNQELSRHQRIEKYEKDLAIAKENGWERPQRPEDY